MYGQIVCLCPVIPALVDHTYQPEVAGHPHMAINDQYRNKAQRTLRVLGARKTCTRQSPSGTACTKPKHITKEPVEQEEEHWSGRIGRRHADKESFCLLMLGMSFCVGNAIKINPAAAPVAGGHIAQRS